MLLIAQHNSAAFSQIFDRYGQAIYAFAAHMLDNDSAEEVVQEVFLRCWNKSSQFDSQRGSLRSWLFGITRHYILNELRHRNHYQRLHALEEIEGLISAIADPHADVEKLVWTHVQQDQLMYALRDLPDEQRKVLIMAYFGGLSHSQIAQQLKLPLGTVKKRVQLGMQKLRLALIEHTPDNPELG